MMNYFLVIISLIIFVCIFLNKVSSRLGVPVLLLFIVLGFLSGWTDTVDVERSRIVEKICTFSLIFIMFYGGFGTRWSSARPVVTESGLLATLGVVFTAGLTGLFCHYAMHWEWIESFLMGSVVSSTDAATVFSILRSKKMGLKNNSAQILEIESGSNDPCSNILTILMLTLLGGNISGGGITWMIFSQFIFGIIIGLLIAMGAAYILKRRSLGVYTMLFIFAVAILAYGLPSLVGGNGYLSAYIVGIILGNTEFKGRKPMVNFFDGVTSLMQIIIFFLLGYLVTPGSLMLAVVPATLIFLFMTLIARPAAVSSVLVPFNIFKEKPYKAGQIGLISFVGLRGAASIVFAIMTLTQGEVLQHDIFSIVFCIVLISMSLQGSLIPAAAKAFKMVDNNQNIMSTFSDFGESTDMAFSLIGIKEDDNWCGHLIKDLQLPKEVILTVIIRQGEYVVPTGGVRLQCGDKVVICGKAYSDATSTSLIEHTLSKGSVWDGKPLSDYKKDDKKLVVMVRHNGERIIPRGDTVVHSGDTLVLLDLTEMNTKVDKN